MPLYLSFLPPSTGADDLAFHFFSHLSADLGRLRWYVFRLRHNSKEQSVARRSPPTLHSSFMSLPSVSFFLGFENVCDPRRHRGTYRQEGRRSFERDEEVVFGGLAEETIIKDFQLYRSICLRSYGSSKKQRPEGTSLCLEPAPSWQHESFLFRRY